MGLVSYLLLLFDHSVHAAALCFKKGFGDLLPVCAIDNPGGYSVASSAMVKLGTVSRQHGLSDHGCHSPRVDDSEQEWLL